MWCTCAGGNKEKTKYVHRKSKGVNNKDMIQTVKFRQTTRSAKYQGRVENGTRDGAITEVRGEG